MAPPGIDPETARLVAQCLNYYATPGPEKEVDGYVKSCDLTVSRQRLQIICPESFLRLDKFAKALPKYIIREMISHYIGAVRYVCM